MVFPETDNEDLDHLCRCISGIIWLSWKQAITDETMRKAMTEISARFGDEMMKEALEHTAFAKMKSDYEQGQYSQ